MFVWKYANFRKLNAGVSNAMTVLSLSLLLLSKPYLWHLLPMNAEMILQCSQAEGFPYCLTICSHFLQTGVNSIVVLSA